VKELVVGVDGSDESRAALQWAATVAEASGAALRVVAAWTYPGISVLAGVESPVAPDEMDRRTTEEASRLATEVLREPPASMSVEALRGPAAGAILAMLTAESTLVLGSRGRGGFTGLLLGSVSRECIEHAPCPVVIVRQPKPVGEGNGPIVVGMDGSANGELALEWALDLRNAVGGEVVALYVWETGQSEVRPPLRERLTAQARAAVERWAAKHDDVRAADVEGEARQALATGAEDLKAAVLVVGRRGTSRVRGITLGSVTSYLVSNSSAPVAVVPPRAD
jgi:nucleotide-binding universal stress UspA family protein